MENLDLLLLAIIAVVGWGRTIIERRREHRDRERERRRCDYGRNL